MPGPAARAWLSDLVTRIDAADRAERRAGSGRRAGTVVVHVEIGADGALQRAEVERSSGSPALDQRALRAVRGVGPLSAPPAGLLGSAGVADLSIPVELGR
jgi:TonB family protein